MPESEKGSLGQGDKGLEYILTGLAIEGQWEFCHPGRPNSRAILFFCFFSSRFSVDLLLPLLPLPLPLDDFELKAEIIFRVYLVRADFNEWLLASVDADGARE